MKKVDTVDNLVYNWISSGVPVFPLWITVPTQKVKFIMRLISLYDSC